MQSIIKQLLNMFEDLFNGKYEACKFSVDMPKFICQNYEIIEKEKKGLGYYLDQEVPDICDEGEPGFDPTHMIAELKKVYDKAKEIYEKAE